MKILCIAVIFTIASAVFGGSAADFERKYPERWQLIQRRLNPAAVPAGVFSASGSAVLLDHFRQAPANQRYQVDKLGKNGFNLQEALQNIYTMQLKKGQLPLRPDGHIQWNFIPQSPVKCDIEFPVMVSRFGGLGYAIRQFHQTGNPEFSRWINEKITDFIEGTPPPVSRPPKSMNAPVRIPVGQNYVWRTLDAGLRARSWIAGFFTGLQTRAMQEDTALLVLSSLIEHADYLLHCGGTPNGANWSVSEMHALMEIACAFPELREAPFWAEVAGRRYMNVIADSVYPDGSQAELAHGYGYNVMRDSVKFKQLAQASGFQLPPDFDASLKRQLDFYAAVSSPDGHLFAHGDTDNTFGRSVRRNTLELLRKFDRQEALYTFSGGKEGRKPQGLPSRFFDYAGVAVMQSDFSPGRQWAAFDIGPFGIGHYHPDKLSLVLFDGRELLCDPGRFSYNWNGGWSPLYFNSTAGHNTIRIDGCDQYMPRWDEKKLPEHQLRSLTPIRNPLNRITPDFDQFNGRLTSGYREPRFGKRLAGRAEHDRTVHYQRGRYWLVLDRIFTDRPRKIEAFWHFGPEVKKVVSTPSGACMSLDADGRNLLILPLTGTEQSSLQLYRGSNRPIQGWYASRMNQKQPIWAACYSADIRQDAVFGWLLLPFDGSTAPEASARLVRLSDSAASVEVSVGGKTATIELPLRPE